MRLLMLNGNTSQARTDWMAGRARAFCGDQVEVQAETAARGASTASRRDRALAAAGLAQSLAPMRLAEGGTPP